MPLRHRNVKVTNVGLSVFSKAAGRFLGHDFMTLNKYSHAWVDVEHSRLCPERPPLCLLRVTRTPLCTARIKTKFEKKYIDIIIADSMVEWNK